MQRERRALARGLLSVHLLQQLRPRVDVSHPRLRQHPSSSRPVRVAASAALRPRSSGLTLATAAFRGPGRHRRTLCGSSTGCQRACRTQVGLVGAVRRCRGGGWQGFVLPISGLPANEWAVPVWRDCMPSRLPPPLNQLKIQIRWDKNPIHHPPTPSHITAPPPTTQPPRHRPAVLDGHGGPLSSAWLTGELFDAVAAWAGAASLLPSDAAAPAEASQAEASGGSGGGSGGGGGGGGSSGGGGRSRGRNELWRAPPGILEMELIKVRAAGLAVITHPSSPHASSTPWTPRVCQPQPVPQIKHRRPPPSPPPTTQTTAAPRPPRHPHPQKGVTWPEDAGAALAAVFEEVDARLIEYLKGEDGICSFVRFAVGVLTRG
jgi:uncharacterized membrane protein YgcG